MFSLQLIKNSNQFGQQNDKLEQKLERYDSSSNICQHDKK